MHRIPTTAAALLLCIVAAPANAGDAAAGQAKSAMCAACHGPAGMSAVPIYPNLAGQKEQYLVAALKAYKSGERSNAIMKPMATPLSDTDIENLAAFYAGKSCS